MSDYGQPITLGLSLYPSVEVLEYTKQLAQAADAAGPDYLAIQDHAYNMTRLVEMAIIVLSERCA
jgi:hypothetical protein